MGLEGIRGGVVSWEGVRVVLGGGSGMAWIWDCSGGARGDLGFVGGGDSGGEGGSG